jgi:hypothetical protein
MENSIDINTINHNKYENNLKYQKMLFLFNALEEGWTIQKKKDFYIFKKKHEGKKEVYLDNYLKAFIERNST